MSNKVRNTILAGVLAFLMQLVLSEWLSIRGIRPDFIAIFIIYSAMTWGSFYIVWVGFMLGVLVDLFGSGDTFGVSSILYVILAFFTGYVPQRTYNFPPLYFHFAWIAVFILSILIHSWFQYPILFAVNKLGFLWKSLLISGYTLGFMGLLQFLIPLPKDVR